MKLFTFLLMGVVMGFSTTTISTAPLNVAPEISLNNPDGVEIKLSSLRGNITLLDFWASWCKPCRMKHPELVNVYNQFKDVEFKKGGHFEIYSVSLDKRKSAWEAAIKKDGLTWSSHVSDLKGWHSEAANTYDINSIPQNLLLNEKGEIIGTNLFGKELAAVLSKLQ